MEFLKNIIGKNETPKQQGEEAMSNVLDVTSEDEEANPTVEGIEVEELDVEEIEVPGVADDAEAGEDDEEATEMPSTAGYEVTEQKSEDVEDEELREAA